MTGNRALPQSEQRYDLLDHLHTYWRRAKFPINTYTANKRTPVFIDESGTHCAVGYLMLQTGYGELAQQIDAHSKFVQVDNIDDRDTETWLKVHGLSREEAALVQPGYGGYVIERVNYSVQDILLALVALVGSVLLVLLVGVLVWLLRKRGLAKPKRKARILQLSAGIAVLTASFVFVLPPPHHAVNAVTAGNVGSETTTCNGWTTTRDKLPSECKAFEQEGEASGWKAVPCGEYCLY